jgi:hypothetical protein
MLDREVTYNSCIQHIYIKYHLGHEIITTLLTALAATIADIQLYAFIFYVVNN